MTLFGAIGEHTRAGLECFGFEGRLDANGKLVIETPFRKIVNVSYLIHADRLPIPPLPPATAMCTIQTVGGVVTLWGWKHNPPAIMPLIASDGEELLTVLIFGIKRK